MATDGRLARDVARRIESEIIARGWPVGEILGTEDSLIETYGVSRPVWREAVRLLEQDNIGRIQMGRNGGLVVTAPNAEAVVRTAALYFRYEAVGPDELYQTWLNLETMCLKQVVETLTDNGVAELRRAVEDDDQRSPHEILNVGHRNFHAVIADLTGSRPMRLFVEVMMELATAPSREAPAATQKKLATEALLEHRGIANAIITRDLQLAQRLTIEHIEHARATVVTSDRRRRMSR
jgi:DNA-binding FadR family transcriptional regulator